MLADGAVHGEARLSAMTTDQVQVVMDNRDKDAIVFAARARAADNTQKAAESIQQGDREGARKLLQLNTILFDEASAVAGPAAVADDLDNQKKLARWASTRPTPKPTARSSRSRSAPRPAATTA